MRIQPAILAIPAIVLISGCFSASPRQHELDQRLSQSSPEVLESLAQEDADRNYQLAVSERLQHIRELILSGHFDKAQELLSPMHSLNETWPEIDDLQSNLDTIRQIVQEKDKIAYARQVMLADSENQMTLPRSYGRTVTVDAALEPITLPHGPMEELVSRKVTIAHDSLGVKELVRLLVDEGLNAVADEALKESQKISVHVKDVPLVELFAYLSRNMGIAFHIGENLVWITGSSGPRDPQMETRIFRLPVGFVPRVPSGSGLVSEDGGDSGDGGEATDTELEEALALALLDDEDIAVGAPPADDDDDDDDMYSGFGNNFVEPGRSAFRLFPTRNLLIVRANHEKMRLAERIIEEFIRPPVQVVIEAKFITVAQDDLRDLGAELTRINGGRNGALLDVNAQANANLSNFLTELGALKSGSDNGVGALTLSGVLGHRSYDLLISALDKKQSTMTLQVPRVTVLNNRSARIRKGDKLFYFEEYDIETIDRGDRGSDQALVPTGTPTELPIGITFDVNVSVGNDLQTILLGLKPEIVSLLQWETYTTGGDRDNDDSSESVSSTGLTQIKLPRTHEQIVSTSVSINSGETVVMGGMTENSKQKVVKKIPILGDIPLLGRLFRHDEIQETPTNMLIFVTATVLNRNGEYTATAE